jgi:hypothetical protein
MNGIQSQRSMKRVARSIGRIITIPTALSSRKVEIKKRYSDITRAWAAPHVRDVIGGAGPHGSVDLRLNNYWRRLNDLSGNYDPAFS